MGTATMAEPAVRLLTVAEFAAAVGESYSWAYERAAAGRVRRETYPRGKLLTYRIYPDEVDRIERDRAQGLPV